MQANRLTTGVLLVAVPLVFTLGFTGLQASFGYPDILHHPAGEVLTRFVAAGPLLRLYWYAMFAAALGVIPAAAGFALLAFRDRDYAAVLSGVFGTLAGLTQALGLLRWVMLVPVLATAYTAPDATDLEKALAAAGFDSANAYLGMGVGEHLGYFFTALWTLALAASISPRWRWMAWIGVVLALGVAFGMAEPFGVAAAAAVNKLAYTGWSLWLLVLGVLVLWRLPATDAPARVAA